ncbi:MAG: RluA family pseudouridine synthase [Dissulfurimicrobium sp.]|uniref:RluA family pseudouridine synthase n=1 Tax=Dissulfurimicrobium sp. TaxID=2022436 RepID=UPI00404B8DDC
MTLQQKTGVKIIYEDNHLLVLSKPACLLTVPDSTGDLSLLDWAKAYIKETRGKPGNCFLGVVHRLDRPVSGLVCFAKTSKAASRLSEQMRSHAIRKTYLAITDIGPPAQNGVLEHMLKKDCTRNIVQVFSKDLKDPLARPARTLWRIIGKRDGLYLLELTPETGRPHQLRAQCAWMACPLLGDIKYGARKLISDGSIALHAFRLELIHPTTKERMSFEAQLPDTNIWQIFDKPAIKQHINPRLLSKS